MEPRGRAIELLRTHNLRLTETRRQILEIFIEAGNQALSSQDIEGHFEKIDRVTLYRTLRSFEETGLIHEAVDGSHKQKYALCSEECSSEEHQDDHAHFFCTHCEQTICLEGVMVPSVQVPGAYQVANRQLVLSGVCPDCQ